MRTTCARSLFCTLVIVPALLALPYRMKEHRAARNAGRQGPPSIIGPRPVPQKQAAYNASKAALNMFTISLAHELRHTKIKVNSAHPGWVKTDLGGSGAPMNPAEGAKTEVMLATLPDDGPTGGFFHNGQPIAW